MSPLSEADLNKFAERYVDVWNETDPVRRRDKIRDLWAPTGFNQSPSLEATGYDELEKRITASHEKWVVQQGCVFRSLRNATGHHRAVRFNWDMAPRTGGEPLTVGFDFCLLDEDGRIREDYQFIET